MNRRGFITGLISLVAAPAIVRAGSLMPVKSFVVGDGVALYCMPHPEVWRICQIRDLLLPGLVDVITGLDKLPRQWNSILQDTIEIKQQSNGLKIRGAA